MNFDDALSRVRAAKARGYNKHTTRRCVSLRGETWRRVQARAAELGTKPTTLLELWIDEHLTRTP